MSEGSGDDGNYLVRVSAQVMTRDESTGLWVPIRGGGLSNVSVRKRPVVTEDEAKHEYLIFGKRISDQTFGSRNFAMSHVKVVLSCTIKRDFEYNKVMPTFHHWRTGDKKFGLTFQTAADARAFDKGVKQAVEDLLDGLNDSSFLHASDVGEDDVFMTLELPVERVDSRSSSGSSTNGNNSCGLTYPPSLVYPEPPTYSYSSPFTHPHANHHHLHRMHYIPRPQRTSPGNGSGNGNGNTNTNSNAKEMTLDDVWVKNSSGLGSGLGSGDDKIEIMPGEQFSYVQFAPEARPTPHEYSYPVIDVLKEKDRDRDRDKCAPPSAFGFEAKPPLLPTKKRAAPRNKDKDKGAVKNKSLVRERARCRHCHEMFGEEEKERGRCEYAPDHARTCVDAVTCIRCAQCMLYHCMSDAEGDFAHHPCSCDATDPKCGKRWFGLVLLSLLVPCLCCYLPLWACHKCGASCGVCGGRHQAS